MSVVIFFLSGPDSTKNGGRGGSKIRDRLGLERSGWNFVGITNKYKTEPDRFRRLWGEFEGRVRNSGDCELRYFQMG